MKIALIYPKSTFFSKDREFIDFWAASKDIIRYKKTWQGFCSGLLIVAALTPEQFKIKFIDENIETINFDEDFDLIAISIMTQQAMRGYEIADKFRKNGSNIVIGGIHATILPKEAKEHADSVIIGEAENTWSFLINDFLNGKIRPFYRSEVPADLTMSPVPKYELIKPTSYEMVWVQTSRGCPYDCEFCCSSKVFGSKFRHKNIEQVIREIRVLKDMWRKNDQIGFADDNMFINKKYSRELIKEIGNLNINWFAQSDISIAEDEDFLKFIRENGCKNLFIGFESASQESISSINKNSWKAKLVNNYTDYINRIQQNGIGIMGAFILGFDNDDITVFDKLSDFIINNNLFASQISILTPLPGTKLRERLEKENRLLPTNWDNYTLGDINFVPKKMTPEELQKGLLKVYKRIYNRDVRVKVAKYFKEVYSKCNSKAEKITIN